jgi:hypothetical protein
MSDLEQAMVEAAALADRIRDAISTADRRIAMLALTDVLNELATGFVEEHAATNGAGDAPRR